MRSSVLKRSYIRCLFLAEGTLEWEKYDPYSVNGGSMRSFTRTVTYFLWSPLSANPIPIRTLHAFTAGRAAAWWMGLLQTEQWNNYSCAPSLSALFSKGSLFKKEKGPITQSINDQLSNCCTCVDFHISRVPWKKKKKLTLWLTHYGPLSVLWLFGGTRGNSQLRFTSDCGVITLTAYCKSKMLTVSSWRADSTAFQR